MNTEYHIKTAHYDVMWINELLAKRTDSGYFLSGVINVITASYFKIGDTITLCTNPKENHFGNYRVNWVIEERFARSVVRPYWQKLQISKI